VVCQSESSDVLSVGRTTNRVLVSVSLQTCGLTISYCQELAETMNRTKRVFQAGTQPRSVPNFQLAVELARSRTLGKLQTLYASLPHRLPRRGPLLDPSAQADHRSSARGVRERRRGQRIAVAACPGVLTN
jgi:hypothetical protein